MLRCPFLALLAGEWLLSRLFWSMPRGVSRLVTAVPTSLVEVRQKENPGISPSCCFLGPEVSGGLLSSHCTESSYALFLCNIQGF